MDEWFKDGKEREVNIWGKEMDISEVGRWLSWEVVSGTGEERWIDWVSLGCACDFLGQRESKLEFVLGRVEEGRCLNLMGKTSQRGEGYGKLDACVGSSHAVKVEQIWSTFPMVCKTT